MEISNYAPVLIPTLNRYVHFKRCLESLERCTGSSNTDVYVALDYPPSDKYVRGWKLIDQYLANKEASNSFKSLTVYRRKENYFFSGKGNLSTAVNDLPASIDYYIISEDDNEFSMNFLDYMNKCGERFSKEDNVFQICGYNYFKESDLNIKNNYYYSQVCSAWGIGTWRHKQKDYLKYRDLAFLRNIIRKNESYKKLNSANHECIEYIIRMLKLKKIHGDATWEIYCILENKYMVSPLISKVRNHGNDGTGVHSLRMDREKNDYYSLQKIDMESTFEFRDITGPAEILPITNNSFPKKSLRNVVKRFIMKFDIILLRFFNILPKSKYI